MEEMVEGLLLEEQQGKVIGLEEGEEGASLREER